MKCVLVGTSLVFASICITPPAIAVCDISKTRCMANDGKCNIKFRNRTGESGGSDGHSLLNQSSLAMNIKVSARDQHGNKIGNKLIISAAASKSMNIEKKANKGFHHIRISPVSEPDVQAVSMSCDDINYVLDGNGSCKIFHGVRSSHGGALGYQCDGGNVRAPAASATR